MPETNNERIVRILRETSDVVNEARGLASEEDGYGRKLMTIARNMICITREYFEAKED